MLDIGKFDSLVIFEVGNTSHDSMGGNVMEWEEAVRAWAHVDFKSGKSSDNENRLQTSMSVEFTIKDCSSGSSKITANNWRILYPLNGGASIVNETQYYTVTGIYLWGGRQKYKTMITQLNTNEFEIQDL